jgi:diaminopimelate epimerase
VSSTIQFQKWHGSGNDFLLFEKKVFGEGSPGQQEVESWCNRRTGIGADGLIVVHPVDKERVEMQYFNSDGHPGSMCGNGGRCAAKYAFTNGWAEGQLVLDAPDGVHLAQDAPNGNVVLGMIDTPMPEAMLGGYFLYTGSPHLVLSVDGLDDFDADGQGRKWRSHERFKPKGTNVNFLEERNGQFFIRTFERGVEEETLSCGTGTVAAALVLALQNGWKKGPVTLNAPGGVLSVDFLRTGNGFGSVTLCGPTAQVFSGRLERG